MVAPPDLPRAADVHLDATNLALTVLLSILAGVVFGTAPAILASRPDLDGFGGSFTVFDSPPGEDEGNAQVRSVTPGYLEALSIPLVSGRALNDQDSEGAARVALVSEATARKYWPGENPVGKQLRLHVN